MCPKIWVPSQGREKGRKQERSIQHKGRSGTGVRATKKREGWTTHKERAINRERGTVPQEKAEDEEPPTENKAVAKLDDVERNN